MMKKYTFDESEKSTKKFAIFRKRKTTQVS